MSGPDEQVRDVISLHPVEPVLVLVGPTAVGKSALSLELARRLGGEVINADSMQLYRGLDIGTAKLSVSERGDVPHHLLDIWDLDRLATVAEYQQLARTAIADVQSRGRVAILVGGSGLYVNAVIDDLQFPGTDPAIRARWQTALDALGPAQLHSRLAQLDPAAAARIEPGNGRRIVRALEVIELTGQPFQAQLPFGNRYLPATVIGLDVPRPVLDERIATRVESMWSRGLVQEVVQLVRQGLEQAPTASRALGYSQVLDMLAGRISESVAVQSTIIGTRRFARRQLAWFRRDERVRWIGTCAQDSTGSDPHDEIAELTRAAAELWKRR